MWRYRWTGLGSGIRIYEKRDKFVSTFYGSNLPWCPNGRYFSGGGRRVLLLAASQSAPRHLRGAPNRRRWASAYRLRGRCKVQSSIRFDQTRMRDINTHYSITRMISLGVSYTSWRRTTRGDWEQRDSKAISCLSSALQSALNRFLEEYFAAYRIPVDRDRHR